MLSKVINGTVALLFLAVVVLAVFTTTWTTVNELPQNPADQSNIEAIGVQIFTQFVIPFEVLSLVLLGALIGSVYIAKSEVEQ